jgi:SAM-dependent methyltransferase
MVVDALASVGVDVARAGRGLDFGCSSGRVVRVLHAAYPDLSLVGCDPNTGAVNWASEHLPGIDFFVSPQEPPLELEYGSLDFAYAISIWSHFAPDLGMRWFDEIHRSLRPGGHLVFTTHGLESIAYYANSGMRTLAQSEEIERAVFRDGYWYAPEFGDYGDWGVINQSWGTCFLSPEWVLNRLCPLWRVLEFAPGRNQSNQDVYVLQRG